MTLLLLLLLSLLSDSRDFITLSEGVFVPSLYSRLFLLLILSLLLLLYCFSTYYGSRNSFSCVLLVTLSARAAYAILFLLKGQHFLT